MSDALVILTDTASGAQAKILVDLGFNCYEFQVIVDDRPMDVLWAAPDFASGQHAPSGSGIPILFPFPGRIRGTTLAWRGKSYTLQEGDGRGNAIHGLVYTRPWRVVDRGESWVIGQFQASTDEPELLPCWPADFRITVRYEVSGSSLVSTICAENPDQRPLPFGLGVHPYFRVPLHQGRSADCLVRLPVSSSWELIDMQPSGARHVLQDAARFQQGLPLDEMDFDNVFSDLQFERSECSASIWDAASGQTVTMTFDRTFRECVVYNPPHRQAICIEPYTCVPGAFQLDPQLDTGLRQLQPGQRLETQITIRAHTSAEAVR